MPVLGLVLGLLFVGFETSYAQRRENVLDDLVRSAQAAAVVTDLAFDEAISVGRAIAAEPVLRSLDLSLILAHLLKLDPLYPQYENLLFVDAQGFARVSARERAVLDPPVYVGDRLYFQRLLATGEPAVSELLLSRLIGRPVVPVGVPITGEDGRLLGVATAVVDTRYLGQRLQALGLPSGGAIALYDNMGRLAYFSMPVELAWEERDFSAVPEVQRALAGQTVRTAEFRSPLRPGTALVLGGTRSPKYGWVVTVSWPAEQAFGPLEQSFRLQLLVFGSISIGAIVLAVLFAWFITRPVESLAAQAQALGRGELARRVEIETGDELETLGHAFNAMAARLQEIMAREQSARAEAEERTRELEEERRRREVFVSAIAHDLKNMMTPIIGTAQMLSRWERLAAEARAQLLGNILGQVQRIDRLVSDLLDVSRIEARRFGLIRRRTDMVALARQVVQEQQASTQKHRIVVEAPEHLWGHWDLERLAQVLTNLLNNAIKYSPEGGEVRVSIQEKDGQARLCVVDQGVGIRAEDLAIIFNPYARLYQERRAIGLGLGLYICKAIIEAHEGRIWASSPGPSRGSTFCFTLPLG